MKSLNCVMLIGNVGKDPELSYTPSGVAVAKFSVATSEQWKDGDGNKQERTDWHNIVAWKKLAEIISQYVHKGSKVFVEGKLQTRSWDDKQTGAKRYATEIVIDNLIMLDGQSSTDSQPETPATTQEKDSLPF
jgi:single-strand DNA-binding protein